MSKFTSRELMAKKFKHIASGVISCTDSFYEGFSIFKHEDIDLKIKWEHMNNESKTAEVFLKNIEIMNEYGNELLTGEHKNTVVDVVVNGLNLKKYIQEELEKHFSFREFHFEPFYIERDKNLPLKFMGTNLGSASEAPLNALNVTLYWTKEGQFVCEKNFDNSDSKDRNHTAEICSTVSEIYNFIGNHELAKQLIQAANVDFSIVVK